MGRGQSPIPRGEHRSVPSLGRTRRSQILRSAGPGEYAGSATSPGPAVRNPWVCAQIATWALWRALGDVRGMGRPSPDYTPKAPAQGVLHRVVRDHFEVLLDLRHRWTDGTTQLLFEPVELQERLAALTPRPRINLLLYYGVLGARSATPIRPRTNWLWAELMQRSFGFDVLACPRCAGRLELIALIEDPTVIRRILSHLGMPTEVPTPRPARPPPLHPTSPGAAAPPPLPLGRSDPWYDQDVSVP